MTKAIFEQTYKITSIYINTNKELSLYGLLGFLQDIASEHSRALGFGYESMKAKDIFWVLIRQKLTMEQWPQWHDKIRIKTWTLPIKSFYASREFEIYLNDQKIGACATTWMILDSKTRKPKEVSKEALPVHPRTDYRLTFSANKIKLPDDLKLANTLTVRNSHLDMNHHVNNVKYSQWILDTIPITLHKEFDIKIFEINFVAETFLNDTMECYHNVTTDTTTTHEYFFMGKNTTHNKIAFVARIKI